MDWAIVVNRFVSIITKKKLSFFWLIDFNLYWHRTFQIFCLLNLKPIHSLWDFLFDIVYISIFKYLREYYWIVFQFQFVNSFLSLFYIAFYLQDQEKLKEVSYFPNNIFFVLYIYFMFKCFLFGITLICWLLNLASGIRYCELYVSPHSNSLGQAQSISFLIPVITLGMFSPWLPISVVSYTNY